MKVALLSLKLKGVRCFNRDTAGGFGTATRVGTSLRAKIIEFIKSKTVRIPLISFAYIAAILKREGHEVEYREEGIPNADVILIASSPVGCKSELALAKAIKSATCSKIGFIGPFAAAVPEHFLTVGDFVVVGEPEAAAYRIAAGEDLRGVVKSDPIAELDSIPFPDWGPFPVSQFSYFPLKRPLLTMLTSRGCPMRCQYYCPYPLAQGNRWRARRPDNVLEEIEYLRKEYGVNSVQFRDPMFSYDTYRCREIASLLIERGLQITWGCEAHLDFMDNDTLDLMHKSGLRQIEVGIESVDCYGLKKIGRGAISTNHITNILKFCEEKGIRVVAFFMLGLPQQTREDMQATMEYARKLNIFAAQFGIFTSYPGTRFYEEVVDSLNRDWEHYDGYTPVFEHKHLSNKQLVKLRERAFIKFYFEPRRMAAFIKAFFFRGPRRLFDGVG